MRRRVHVTFAPWHVALGWAAFGNLAVTLRRVGLGVDQLEYLWHSDESGLHVSTFEVRETPTGFGEAP